MIIIGGRVGYLLVYADAVGAVVFTFIEPGPFEAYGFVEAGKVTFGVAFVPTNIIFVEVIGIFVDMLAMFVGTGKLFVNRGVELVSNGGEFVNTRAVEIAGEEFPGDGRITSLADVISAVRTKIVEMLIVFIGCFLPAFEHERPSHSFIAAAMGGTTHTQQTLSRQRNDSGIMHSHV